MFNLLANTMFEATRIPAPSTAPLRTRWTHDRGPAPAARGRTVDGSGKTGSEAVSGDAGTV